MKRHQENIDNVNYKLISIGELDEYWSMAQADHEMIDIEMERTEAIKARTKLLQENQKRQKETLKLLKESRMDIQNYDQRLVYSLPATLSYQGGKQPPKDGLP
eukprot:UN13260